MGSQPSRLPFLRRRWCVLPKVMQGTHHVIRHVSMGLKQSKKPLCHDWAESGDLLLRYSAGWARTWLKRSFQSSMSLLLMGPLLFRAPVAIVTNSLCSFGLKKGGICEVWLLEEY